jgi:hypothetical protein
MQVLGDSDTESVVSDGAERRRREEEGDSGWEEEVTAHAVVRQLDVLGRGVRAIHRRLGRSVTSSGEAGVEQGLREAEALLEHRGSMLARMQHILDHMHLKPRRLRSFTTC